MATRGQVAIKQENSTSVVYLYQHYDGYELPGIVKEALKKKQRWNDYCYLARIIFCEMVKDDIYGTTCYGIDTERHGDIDELVEILSGQKIRVNGGKIYTFEEFINLTNEN